MKTKKSVRAIVTLRLTCGVAAVVIDIGVGVERRGISLVFE